MDEMLVVSAPPHIHSKLYLRSALFIICLCLLPSLIAGIIYFGVSALLIVVVSILSSMILEGTIEYLKERKITIKDSSALLIGLLMGMMLPPGIPLWFPILGSCLATILVKQVFKTLGVNLLNPVLAARALLLLAFPNVLATAWKPPLNGTLSGIDALTYATPLTILKNYAYYGISESVIEKFNSTSYLKILLIGQIGGSIGETCKLTIIIGGIILLLLGIIDLRIVAGYIFSFCILNLFLPGGINPLFQLLSGGVLFAIFFISSDWMSSPITKSGRLVFGIGCGLLTAFFRHYLPYPEGVTSAILLMNLLVPMIDRLTIDKSRFDANKKELSEFSMR